MSAERPELAVFDALLAAVALVTASASGVQIEQADLLGDADPVLVISALATMCARALTVQPGMRTTALQWLGQHAASHRAAAAGKEQSDE